MDPYPPRLFILGIVGLFFIRVFAQEGEISLKFVKEPPGKVDFLNTKGVQIECLVQGKPNPIIQWKTADGNPVTAISGLRDVQSSGRILNFHPFTADKYRIDIHNTIYRCIASNAGGIIISRDVNVNGVVLQNHDIQVYDTFAIEGNTAVFKCHIPSVLSDYVRVTAWIKNDNLLIQSGLDESNDEKYTIMPTGELHIRDVSKGDSGSRYKCKTVHRLNGETKDSSNTGQLLVTASHGTVPPRIADSYSSVTATHKQTAVLGCVAQGNPPPTVNWFKKSPLGQSIPLRLDGKIIQRKSMLMIKDVQVADAGVFVCEAVNDLGKEQQEITLTVQEPLKAVMRTAIQRVKLNDRVKLVCDITGNPQPVISWLHNGSPLVDKSRKNELVLENVQMSDRGMYQCIATNNLETVQTTAEIQLSEISPYFVETFKEENLQPGNSLSMKCVASGIPLPSIVWKLEETAIVNNARITIVTKPDSNGRIASILKIEKVAVEDGGVYSCIANSDAGSTTHFAKINVYGPLGKRPMQEKLGIAGHNVMLHCPMYGYPIDNIVWEKDNKILPANMNQDLMRNGSLGIQDINKFSDAGIYKCYVEDITKPRVEAQVKLDVMVPPKLVPFEFQEELLREGMRARLQCVVSEGDLPLSVSWLKDGKPFSDNLGVTVRTLDEFSSILTISSITPRHNGRYTCVAVNKAATVTHSAQLSVNVPPKIVPFEFVGNHFEGSPARVVCGLQEGDAPIQFSWLHENDPVVESNTLSVHEVDGLSSILSIPKLSSAHKGIYTCIAKNGAGADRYQAALHVHGNISSAPSFPSFSSTEDRAIRFPRGSCVRGSVGPPHLCSVSRRSPLKNLLAKRRQSNSIRFWNQRSFGRHLHKCFYN